MQRMHALQTRMWLLMNYKALALVVLVALVSMAVPAALTVYALIHCGLKFGAVVGLLLVVSLLVVRGLVR